MRASNRFSHSFFWYSNRQNFLLFVTLLLLVFLAFGCKKDPETVDLVPEPIISIQVPDTSNFIQLAKTFVNSAQLPITLNDITIEDENEIQDLEKIAREIVDEMVFIKEDSVGNVIYNKVKDGSELAEVMKDDAARSLIDEKLIEKGDFVVKAEWVKENGETFFTLGVISADGKPKFEPILHFTGLIEVHIPHPMQRGWGWGPFIKNIKNGFGSTCVEVEFTVHIATDPNNCQIVDPGPHIQITKAISNCWGWEQETSKGEINWCNPHPECECRFENVFPAEECIKFVVVTYIATGFSDIEIEAGVAGTYKGFTVDSKVKMKASRFGAEATFETIRSICASGSTP